MSKQMFFLVVSPLLFDFCRKVHFSENSFANDSLQESFMLNHENGQASLLKIE